MWNRKVFIRIIEVLLCIACVVALRITDDESHRVSHYLRNRSREWSLLNNVTWGVIGAALATATCGGYVIVTAGLLVAAASGELRGRKTEIFFLGVGIILFAIVGALSLASIEDVPPDLVDNAAVFGALCLLTALVFIVDLLIGLPKTKDKQNATQNLTDKNSATRQVTTTLSTENEPSKTDDAPKSSESRNDSGNVNNGFDRTDDPQRKIDDRNEDFRKIEQHRFVTTPIPRPKDVYQEERNRNFDHVERELREYTQNFENGRVLRDSQKYREAEMQRNALRDSYDNGRRMEQSRIMYKTQDIYQRPVDEVDTPRFPTETENRAEPMFAKMVNPSVKIMRVERDVDEVFDTYRYSDTSQYDNVPIKMRGTSPGILKKNRDVSFNVPPPPKNYIKGYDRTKDDIEMLEECFDVLKTTTTGTQTGVPRTPSSPTDPGYVRHTASNWPQETKTKTPGPSPDHTKNH